MKRTRFYLMILSFLLLNVISLYGLNVSILIFQKDGIDKVSESSRVFENQIMNTLFDYGHIVTNETISLYENYDMASVNGFNAAVDGFMDYFVEIKLEYDISQSKNPEAVSLENLKSVDSPVHLALLAAPHNYSLRPHHSHLFPSLRLSSSIDGPIYILVLLQVQVKAQPQDAFQDISSLTPFHEI